MLNSMGLKLTDADACRFTYACRPYSMNINRRLQITCICSIMSKCINLLRLDGTCQEVLILLICWDSTFEHTLTIISSRYMYVNQHPSASVSFWWVQFWQIDRLTWYDIISTFTWCVLNLLIIQTRHVISVYDYKC